MKGDILKWTSCEGNMYRVARDCAHNAFPYTVAYICSGQWFFSFFATFPEYRGYCIPHPDGSPIISFRRKRIYVGDKIFFAY